MKGDEKSLKTIYLDNSATTRVYKESAELAADVMYNYYGNPSSLHRKGIEAEKIVKNIDKEVYIKIPVTEEGLKAIKNLKSRGFNITATAIYTKMQGLVAIAAGADYIAPYFNRIQSRGADASQTIACFRQNIDYFGKKTKILAASFHHGGQVTNALQAGADSVTIQPDLLREMVCANYTNYIDNAVTTFAADWESSQGTKSIIDCEE